jgi:OHCU decarboxylase
MNEPTKPHLPPISELNRMSQEAFAAALKPLFEAAPPLAEGLFAMRPFASYVALLDQAEAIIATLTEAQQIEVINAHPRIGERADTVRQQSAISYREQGYDREAETDQAALTRVYQELAELNRRYEARFGFRFVVFVNRRPKSAIVGVLRERLGNSREAEMANALDAMLAIARDRLRTMMRNEE